MSVTDNSLLSKWSCNSGLSGSLFSSTLLSSKPQQVSESFDRKRRIDGGQTGSLIANKKLKEDAHLKNIPLSLHSQSSVLNKYGATSDLVSTTKMDTTGTSSLLSSSLSMVPKLHSDLTSVKRSKLEFGSSMSNKVTLRSSLTTTQPSQIVLKTSCGSPSLLSKTHISSILLKAETSMTVGTLTGATASKLECLRVTSTIPNIGKLNTNLVGQSSSAKTERALKKDDTIKNQKTGDKTKNHKKAKLDSLAALPQYNLANAVTNSVEMVLPRFVPPERDTMLLSGIKLHDVNGLKLALVNAVSGSLICQPNFQFAKDLTRITLMTMSEKVICYDPEFILKVALYTRQQLNIRTTANFLLALASHMPACRPFLKKYFRASIALPSDWIEVAEIYSALPEKTLPLGSLPSALRKAMIVKFPDFDKYQLAKYNKESSKKKKKKKKQKKSEETESSETATGSGRGRGGRSRGIRGTSGWGKAYGRGLMKDEEIPSLRALFDSDSDSDSGNDLDSDEEMKKHKRKGLDEVKFDDDDTPEQLQKMSFTLKQLIRKLHITEPVEHVMCLIGKKYPSSLEEFYKFRLPGTFEEERAGKRMKLPVPETWETQVSMKGNKAATWEELIDHKKLPFMAMLRNLRNVIRAGISQKHHNNILRRLTDEKSVINSKQFPFRFFSAYEVLEQLRKEFEESQQAIIQEAVAETSKAGGYGGKERGRDATVQLKKEKLTAENWWIVKKKRKLANKKNKTKETSFDTNLIIRYRKALDTAVKIATVYNVQPIRGRSVILCDVGPNMAVPCTAARGLGKPRTMQEVSILLGLMCKYSCEDCVLVIFNSSISKYCIVEVDNGTILENMATVLEKNLADDPQSQEGKFEAELPMSILFDQLRDRIQIDNLLVLSGGEGNYSQRAMLNAFLEPYRRIVNPDLLYVFVSFYGKSCGFTSDIKPEHDNNIYISGFSDQILRFIAERGDGGQLRYIEKIDEAFELKSLLPVLIDKPSPPKLAIDKPLSIALQSPSWRTARVFISSTFRDMHGERDLLTRFVFPELRALGKKHFINIYEIDLRWGMTEEDTRNEKTLELCLTEVYKSQFFVGILGERYGWVPGKYVVPDTPPFSWVKEYPPGASITELEIHAAALGRQKDIDMIDRAFFFLRDPAFESAVPKLYKEDFLSESSSNHMKMESLKEKIKTSNFEVFDKYPCCWSGVVDGKPIVSGLEQFGSRALNNLWNGIQKFFPDKDAMLNEASHTTKLHEAFVTHLKDVFVGRSKLKKECVKIMGNMKSGVITLVGKPGSGKSALLASLISDYMSSPQCDSGLCVLTHFVGAAPGSTNLVATLTRLCHELNCRYSLQMDVPVDFKNLVGKFEEMLKEAGKCVSSPLVVVIDGMDGMEPAYLPQSLDWLPEKLPENVIFILTCLTEGKVHQSLKHRNAMMIAVETLDMWDKSEVVRTQLAIHKKTLDESPFNNQMKLLVSKKEASIPLYLSLACEELRVFGLFEKVTDKLKTLPQTVSTLLQDVLSRLESDFGKDLMSTSLSLLIYARDGLEAEELHDILSLHRILDGYKPKFKEIVNIQLSPEACLPSATFAHLRRSLHGFLNPTDSWNSRLCLAHTDIELAVRQRYLKGSTAMETELYLHRLLAGYFYIQGDVDRDGSWKGKSARAFREVPYHLAKSASFADLEEVVCNLLFVYNKCMLGMTSSLIEDYQPLELSNKTHEREQLKFLDKSVVKDYKSFVSRNLHILSSYPALTWQQAYNENINSQPSRDVRNLLKLHKIPKDELSLIEWYSKPVNADPCYLTISNLPQPMTCVSVSSDQQRFSCGGMDCLVHLYDLHTGKELRSFRGHANTVTGVCFVGQNMLCSVSKDSTVSIWDVQNGHRLFTLKGHQRHVNSCSADKAGNVLATASWDCIIKVWGMKKGELLCEFKVGSPVNCVSFHPEGQKIVTGQWDSTIKIWDIFHKTKLAVLRGHRSSIRDIAYSPSGKHIASAALDGDVKLWAADTGAQVGNVCGHALPINKLTFSPSGRELITVSDDHKIKVWSGNLGKLVCTFGSEELGPAISVAISPLRDTVVIGYHSGLVKMFNIVAGTELESRQVHSASVRCLKFLSSAYILTGSDDKTAKILKNNLKDACVISQHKEPLMCVDYCRDYMATASADCTCAVYENPLKYSGKSVPQLVVRLCVLGGHTGAVTSCCFNREGTKIATGSRDMSVCIWDIIDATFNVDNPLPQHVIRSCHNDWVTDLKWSDTADYLITSSNDFNLKVWDVSKIGTTPGGSNKESTETSDCKVKFVMTGHMGSINHIGYSYGCVISTCADGLVKIWSHKGVEITTLYGHTQRANGCDISVKLAGSHLEDPETIDWSTDNIQDKGKILQHTIENVMVATCSDDGTTKVWYPLQANELACLTGHADKVLSVSSNNQGHLCTSSLDKTIKLWKCDADCPTSTGSHDAPVTFVCSNKCGSIPTVLTGSRDGYIKVWSQMPERTTDPGRYTCMVSLKAHEKAVTCGCWLTNEEFVTGSDDETLVIWKLTTKNTAVVGAIRTQIYDCESPVSSIDAADQYIFSIEWNGAIRMWNREKLVAHYSQTNGFLKLRYAGSMTLLLTSVESQVLRFDIVKTKKDGAPDSIRFFTQHSIPYAPNVVHNLHNGKEISNWILDVTGNYNYFKSVDSAGQLSYMENGERVSKKVHSAEVTCILEEQGYIFTGSRDKTIKVWDEHVTQVGQFFCMSPVTSMCVLGNTTRQCVPIVYADELGFVHFLAWRTD